MALISDATTAWSDPVTLTTDEIWQARKGHVYVTTTAVPDAEDGLSLFENHAVQLRAGVTVRYRKAWNTTALIVREQVA